jgi:hypothetical protein
MGLFSFLLGKKSDLSIQHPYFGHMTYHSGRWNIIGNYFTCEPYFQPVAAKVPLNIAASPEGPSPAQTDYFQALEFHYTSLLPVIAPRIKAAAYNGEEEFIFDDFSKDFRLISVQLYADKGKALPCELTYTTDLAPDYVFIVILENLDLKEVLIVE